MQFSDVLPFLQENHMAVATTISGSGRSQSTVVTGGAFDGKAAFVSRGDTVKVRNARRSGRASLTVLKPATGRYVTVEGPATVHGWDETAPSELLALLRQVYSAIGRSPDRWDDFDRSMREEQRTVVLITPQSVYGSLERAST